MILSRKIILRVKNLSNEICRVYQTTHLCSITFSQEKELKLKIW